jgi:hypothetical protein
VPVDYRSHGEVNSAFCHILMDRVIGKTSKGVFATRHNGLNLTYTVGATAICDFAENRLASRTVQSLTSHGDQPA